MTDQNRSPTVHSPVRRPTVLSIRGAIMAGVFAGVLFGVNFGFQALVGLLGMPGASGFVTGFTVPFGLALVSQINKEWGTATTSWTLYSLLAIPTLLMGLPGPYKLILGFLGGLVYDVGYCGLRFRRAGLYVALVLYTAVLAAGFYAVWRLGLFPDMPEERVIKILVVVSAVFLVEGIISTRCATWFYSKRLGRIVEA